MTDLHAIFRATDDGRWQTYSRPESIYVAATSLEEARREFRTAAEFHFDDEWPDVSIVEHVEHRVAAGIYIRTTLDDKVAARDQTAAVIRRSLDVPASLALIHSRALTASTDDIVFVVCEPDDRIDWVSGQLGRVDAVQVCAPIAGEGGVWWVPLATPARSVPAGESETLASAGLGGHRAVVAQLGVWAERYAAEAETARHSAARGARFSPAPTLVAA